MSLFIFYFTIIDHMISLGNTIRHIDKDRRRNIVARPGKHRSKKIEHVKTVIKYIEKPKPDTKNIAIQTDNFTADASSDTKELIQNTTIDVGCVTHALSVCDVACNTIPKVTTSISCDTSELEQREKERKALAAFQKRIAEQKAKAAEMNKFLGKSDNVEDELDDE